MERLQRPLTFDEIEFRPTATANGKVCLSAYKDARLDMNVLDEAVGPGNWQNTYRRDEKGVLFCSIGIYCNNQWVWKESNGVESNTEKEKGEASDAFKRAGFMWGIGRTLYNFPNIWVELLPEENQNGKPNGKFRPNNWQWKVSGDWIEAWQNGKKRCAAKIELPLKVAGVKPEIKADTEEAQEQKPKRESAPSKLDQPGITPLQKERIKDLLMTADIEEERRTRIVSKMDGYDKETAEGCIEMLLEHQRANVS